MGGTETRPPTVVCDAGPVIHLDELDCLDLLVGFPRYSRCAGARHPSPPTYPERSSGTLAPDSTAVHSLCAQQLAGEEGAFPFCWFFVRAR